MISTGDLLVFIAVVIIVCTFLMVLRIFIHRAEKTDERTEVPCSGTEKTHGEKTADPLRH